DLECLSFTIQVLYSFWRTRFSIRGWMLPWQLLEAHDPGPVYFPVPSEALTRAFRVPVRPCEKPSVEMIQAASIATPRTCEMRNRWERSASGIFFISGLRGRDTLPRNQKKNGKQIRALILSATIQVNEIQSLFARGVATRARHP